LGRLRGRGEAPGREQCDVRPIFVNADGYGHRLAPKALVHRLDFQGQIAVRKPGEVKPESFSSVGQGLRGRREPELSAGDVELCRLIPPFGIGVGHEKGRCKGRDGDDKYKTRHQKPGSKQNRRTHASRYLKNKADPSHVARLLAFYRSFAVLQGQPSRRPSEGSGLSATDIRGPSRTDGRRPSREFFLLEAARVACRGFSCYILVKPS